MPAGKFVIANSAPARRRPPELKIPKTKAESGKQIGVIEWWNFGYATGKILCDGRNGWECLGVPGIGGRPETERTAMGRRVRHSRGSRNLGSGRAPLAVSNLVLALLHRI